MLMRKTMAAAVAALVVSTAHAGAVVGATEPTQILNNLELINSTVQQAQMISNQLQNLQRLANSNWGDAQTDLMNLSRVVQTGQGLSYAMSNIDTAFTQKFPGYAAYSAGTNYLQQYRDWSSNTMGALRGALSAAGLQSSQFANERAAMQSIQAMSSGSVGSVQAIQAGTMIASQQVDQLQKLRQLMMTQINSQSQYLAQQEQEKQTRRSAADATITVYTPTTPSFSSKGGSK